MKTNKYERINAADHIHFVLAEMKERQAAHCIRGMVC